MVVGQRNALQQIVPFIQTYFAGLGPANRPAANILLCGNTGLGKTLTVEAIAEVLHGNPKTMLRVDCGEYQADHEVARLVGAPPGYLGHRETHPVFTKQRLDSLKSENCKLSLILFDEIEKASKALTQMLLGVLDKGVLRLGDSTTVEFQDTMIFLSSNLGARQINDAMQTGMGFGDNTSGPKGISDSQIKTVIERSVKKHFSVEFFNRMDELCYYYPFTPENLREIVGLELERLQRHYNDRLGVKTFMLGVGASMFDHILTTGTSAEYGARDLKRKISKYITQDIVSLLNDSAIEPGSVVLVDRVGEESRISVLTDYTELPEGYWFFDKKLSTLPLVMEEEQPAKKSRRTRKTS